MHALPRFNRAIRAYHAHCSDDPVVLVCNLLDDAARLVMESLGGIEDIKRAFQTVHAPAVPTCVVPISREQASEVLAGINSTVSRTVKEVSSPEGTVYVLVLSDGGVTVANVKMKTIIEASEFLET